MVPACVRRLPQVQRDTVVAAAVLADSDQPAQPALQHGEFADLLADHAELRLSCPDDVAGTAALRRAEQVTDLPQREPQPPRPADEGQPPPVILGVLPESRSRAHGQREQALALIEPDRLDADPFSGSQLPDCQPSHDQDVNSRTAVRTQQN